MTWRQVEVEAFMRTVAAGVRPSRPAATGTGGTAADLGELRDLRAAASGDVSPISTDAESTVPEICVVTTLDRLLDDCCSHGLCETSDGQALARGVVAAHVVRRRRLPDGARRFRRGARLRSGPAHGQPQAAAGVAGDAPHLWSSRLHRAVRVVPHPSRPLVDPRPRARPTSTICYRCVRPIITSSTKAAGPSQ